MTEPRKLFIPKTVRKALTAEQKIVDAETMYTKAKPKPPQPTKEDIERLEFLCLMLKYKRCVDCGKLMFRDTIFPNICPECKHFSSTDFSSIRLRDSLIAWRKTAEYERLEKILPKPIPRLVDIEAEWRNLRKKLGIKYKNKHYIPNAYGEG